MDSSPSKAAPNPRMRLPQQPEGLAGEGTALLGFTLGVNVFCSAFVELLMYMSGPNTPTGWPAYFCFGIIASQPLAVGMIVGLLPQNLLFRISLASVAAVSLPFLLIWGGVFLATNNLVAVKQFLPAVPLLCLAASTPLLILKNVSRKRVISKCENQFDYPPTSIGGFIMFTSFAAICIVCLQSLSPVDVKIGGGIACLYFGLSCLIVVPMLLSILQTKHFFRTWIIWNGLAFVLGGVVVYLANSFLATFPSSFVTTVGWAISAAALTVGAGLPLIVIRLSRLEYRVPNKPPAFENAVKQL